MMINYYFWCYSSQLVTHAGFCHHFKKFHLLKIPSIASVLLLLPECIFSFLSSVHFLTYYLVDSCWDQGIKIISLVSYSVSLFFITSYSGIPCYKATSVVRSSSCFWLFVSPWTAACQPPCYSPSPEVCSSSCPLHWWCHPAISSSDVLFSFCPQSFPASGTFPVSWLFTSGDQKTGASASAPVLPMSIRGWFPLRLACLTSLLSRGLSEVFSSLFKRVHLQKQQK